MLYVIVADQKEIRRAAIEALTTEFAGSELLSLDDSMIALPELEQFLYPSLFSPEAPIVHGKFLLADEPITTPFAKALIASPTVFLLEELTLPASVVTALKKAGATVTVGEKPKKEGSSTDFFAATACITAKDKKSRWLAYRAAVEHQPIEALLGILYWKLRTLAAHGPTGNQYERLYGRMLEAQAHAWQNGVPLTEAIEKVLLEA